MKIKKLIAIISMLPLFLFADQTLKELSQLPILNQQNIKVVKYEKLSDGFYMIRTQIIAPNGQTTMATVYTDKKVLFVGKGFDITKEKASEYKFDISKQVKENIAYTIGNPNAKVEYYVVTDIECPFCHNLDASFKFKDLDNIKINVLFHPLSFHLLANSASQYVLSLNSNDERKKATEELMQLVSKKQYDKALLITEKYNTDFYSAVLRSFDNKVSEPYKNGIRKAFKKENLSDAELKKFITKKLDKTPVVKKTVDALFAQLKITTEDLGVRGTPSIFGADFQKIHPQNFQSMHKLFNMKSIEKIENIGLTVPYGQGKEKVYIFLSTKCPACIQKIKNKQFMDKLSKNYNAQFILMPISQNPQELNDIKYILSLNKEKRFDALHKVMTQKRDYDSKNLSFDIVPYLKDVAQTYVNQTPTFINKDGKELFLQ